MDNQNNCAEKMTDKQVMFSCECIYSDECKVCEQTFERKVPLQTTSFYQLDKDITVLVSETESKIIVDTGIPKSILGSKDFQTFRKSLSHFQQENLKFCQSNKVLNLDLAALMNVERKLMFLSRMVQ